MISVDLGGQVLEALGIDPKKRHVTRIIIDLPAHDIPTVEIHEDLTTESGGIAPLFTRYKLVPEDA